MKNKLILSILVAVIQISFLSAAEEEDVLVGALSKLSIQEVRKPYSLRRGKEKRADVLYVDQTEGLPLPLGREQWITCVGAAASNDNFKSHLLASSFLVDAGDEKSVTPSLIKAGGIFGFTDSKKDLVVDWASGASTQGIQKTHKVCSNCGNGHSEPQFVNDFNAAMTRDSTEVIKLFKVKPDQPVVHCGIAFYGSFDMCDACVQTLRAFQAEQRDTQTGLISALKVQLKDNFSGSSFPLVYHSMWPYKDASYSSRNSEGEIISVGYKSDFSGGRKDMFSLNCQGADFIPHDPKSKSFEKDRIYGHIRQLKGKQSRRSAKGDFVFK